MIQIIFLLTIIIVFIGHHVIGCLGFLFFVWLTDSYSLSGKKSDKPYDPEIHRKYMEELNDQKPSSQE